MQRYEREWAAMASLRQRIATAEATNGDLLAFARGHAGVVTAIHESVLAMLSAETLEDFAMIVTRDWPYLLGVDAVAFAWSDGDRAIVADKGGVRSLESRLIARSAGIERAVTAHAVPQGHPFFGAGKNAIRAEILIRLEGLHGVGMLLLGQEDGEPGETAASTRLLRFLGRACSAMLERWPLP